MISNIEKVSGGGKTKEIIEKSDSNSLIVTFTMTLEEDIKRRKKNINVTHYHQLIWDTAWQIGMPLSLSNWDQYENKYIFENQKERISKYSKIFIDIDEESLELSWIDILKRYFLEEDGELFIVKDAKEGESYRLNNSLVKLTNNIFDKKIMSNKIKGEFFYIPCDTYTLINRINEYLHNENNITILSSTLETIRNIERNLISTKTKDLSFITEDEEKEYLNDSFALHSLKKERKRSFNPTKSSLSLSTIESFKGLESEVIFFILTACTSEQDFYTAITRAKNKLYIFDIDNRRFVDTLKLNADIIKDIEYENLEHSIYMAFVPHIQEDVEKRYKIDVNLFFKILFPEHQILEIYNYQMSKKGEQQVAITHANTNVVLLCTQSDKKRESSLGLKIIKKVIEKKDNYFLCIKVITKEKLLLIKNNQLKIDSNLIITMSSQESQVNLDGEILDISQLMESVKELAPVTSVEETSEYKKWKVYLELLEEKLKEKSEIFKVNIEYIDEFRIKFNKPKDEKLKLKKDEEILFNTNKNNGEKLGKIEKVEKNFIFVELDKKFKYHRENEFELYVNHIASKAQIDILKRGLESIKSNDFKFYIFGEQKLPLLNNWQDLEIEFKNQLNIKQQEAIKKALVSEKLFMIQGPPGTGKTTVIAEIAYQESMKGKKVFISSESNDAVENALNKLNEDIFYPLLYQSKSREEKGMNRDLPTDNDVGNFYKKRILKQLKLEIEAHKNIENELEVLTINLEEEKKKISIKIKAFREIEEDNNLFQEYSKKQSKIIEEKIEQFKHDTKELESIVIFKDIQNDFYNELLGNQDCEEELKSEYLKKVNIIGATLGQITKVKVSKNQNSDEIFDVVIVDEVSKATPIELNLAILKAKKIILVGDQKQLPPMLDRDISLEEFSEKIFKNDDENYENEKEVIAELHQHKTVFEKLIVNNPDCYTQLTTQYRMHEKIQKAINQFYDEPLECGVDNLKRINQHNLYQTENLVWIDTTNFKEEKIGTSYKNIEEVEEIQNILNMLEQEYENSNFKPTIGVISFYGLQVNHFFKIENKFKNLKVDFGTVDTFQGQERDFIIISMVRSSDIGFARSLNRINVAFSRAKQLLIILGNKKTFCEINTYDKEDIKTAKAKYKSIYEIAYKGELLK